MTDYRVEALDATTWPAFEALVSKHNGIFGGCWCMWFHDRSDTGPGADASAGARALNSDLEVLTTTIPVYSGLVETARTNNRLGNPVGSAYLGQASLPKG